MKKRNTYTAVQCGCCRAWYLEKTGERVDKGVYSTEELALAAIPIYIDYDRNNARRHKRHKR